LYYQFEEENPRKLEKIQDKANFGAIQKF